MTPYPALLRWADAHSDVVLQTWDLDTFTHSPLIVETLGWVVKYDDTGLSMFTERIDNQDGTFSYRGRGFVPAGMVLEVTPLEGKPRRGRPKK